MENLPTCGQDLTQFCLLCFVIRIERRSLTHLLVLFLMKTLFFFFFACQKCLTDICVIVVKGFV